MKYKVGDRFLFEDTVYTIWEIVESDLYPYRLSRRNGISKVTEKYIENFLIPLNRPKLKLKYDWSDILV